MVQILCETPNHKLKNSEMMDSQENVLEQGKNEEEKSTPIATPQVDNVIETTPAELGIYLCPDCYNAFEEEVEWIEAHTEMDILEDCED